MSSKACAPVSHLLDGLKQGLSNPPHPTPQSLGFAAIWTVLLMIALTVGGTLVMRRYQTPLAIGFFLGCVVVMSNQCLILTAVFGAESETHNDKPAGAFAVFSFFLFAVYGIFAGMLALFKADLVQKENMPTTDPAAIPPATGTALPSAAVPAGAAKTEA